MKHRISSAALRKNLTNGTALALYTYLLLLACRFIDASILTRDNEYFSIVILQIMVFLLPAFACLLLRGKPFFEELPLAGLRADHILLIAAASLTLVSGSILLEMAVGLGKLPEADFSLYDTFVSKNDGTVPRAIYLVMTYAALPAFCEELIYRGIYCAEYGKEGFFSSVGMSMLFFSLLHFDPAGLPVYFFSAILLCATLLATRSLFASMIVHFAYNLFGLFGAPTLSAVFNATGGSWLFIFVLIVTFLLGAIVFTGEAARLYRGLSLKAPLPPVQAELPARDSLRLFVSHLTEPTAIACFVLYLVAVIFF